MQYLERARFNGGTDVVIVKTEAQDPRAELADAILRSMSVNPFMPAGESVSGHPITRRMSPSELALEAARTAEAAWDIYREKGWIIDLPMPKLASDEIVPRDKSPGGVEAQHASD
jgi:hypothetical protein